MGILDVFNPSKIIKIKAGSHASVELAGMKLLDFSVQGFKDEDADGNPEFTLDLDVFNLIKIDNQTVEIPLATVTGGIFGTISKLIGFSGVFDKLGGEKKEIFNRRMSEVKSLIEYYKK